MVAIFAGMAMSSSKPVPTFTMIKPVYVDQGLQQTVEITGTNFAKNTSLVVDGTSYPMSITSSTSAKFTFSPGMTAKVGFLAVQVKTANNVSNTLYFQVCDPPVITTESIPMTVGVPIGPEGKVQTSGGCIWP